MIRLEDEDLEAFSLGGDAEIAVPFSVFRAADGSVTITAYRIALDVANAFEAQFGRDPFSAAADCFLRAELTPRMAKYGFAPDRSSSDVILEWERREPYGDLSSEPAILLTDTPDGGFKSLLTFSPGPAPDDIYSYCAAVTENSRIVSAAQINDLPSDDGCPEINVETAPSFRKKGYAASSVRVLTDALVRHGETVIYACRASNAASAKTAAAAGFTKRGERRSFVCYSI